MDSRPRGASADDEVMSRTTAAMHTALMNILEGKKDGEDIPPGATAIINALASQSNSVSSLLSVDGVSTPMSAVSPPLRTVTLTQSDVKRLPRLCGSVEVGNAGDVDVLSVLQQYRVVA
ncbi:unnamed protein product, partial [Pylaiella littoralis]